MTASRIGARRRRRDGAEHQPDRSTYDCRSCGKSWPCDPGREYLLTLCRDRTVLLTLLADELVRATDVLPRSPTGEMFDRFLAWARPKDVPAGAPAGPPHKNRRKEAPHGTRQPVAAQHPV